MGVMTDKMGLVGTEVGPKNFQSLRISELLVCRNFRMFRTFHPNQHKSEQPTAVRFGATQQIPYCTTVPPIPYHTVLFLLQVDTSSTWT